jgi:vacuolar protein sorting-associated protein 45
MSLNVLEAVRSYVDRIIGDSKMGGMKVLLLDPVTTQVISMVYSQTDVLEKEVYLIEPLGSSRGHEAMHHLKAAVFVQPTRENINALRRELADARYGEYHVFFSNIIAPDLMESLADADAEHELVRQVQEVYADFSPINEDLFHAGVLDSMRMGQGTLQLQSGAPLPIAMQRSIGTVLSVLLALKRKPCAIRYSASSSAACRVAMEVSTRIAGDGIFDFRRREGPLLLVLDRCDDPVTPLLSQWTYQAMVHELLGLNSNRVRLKGAPGIRKELEEVVLSSTSDPFFAKNRFANFGDLGAAVKGLMDEYQQATRLNENIQSIEDMQAFLDRYPAFRSQSLNVSKHVAVLSELARLVEVYGLLDVSAFEQELACDNDHAAHYRTLMDKLASAKVQDADKLRLSMLYALRYEETGNLKVVKTRLADAGLPRGKVELIDALLRYGGRASRGPGLYAHGIMSKIGKSLSTTLQGVQNVYAQHVPPVISIIESAMKGRIREKEYPSVDGASHGKPQEVMDKALALAAW